MAAWVAPVNASPPPPVYWGQVTIIANGDERQGVVGRVEVRHPQRNSEGQWVYDIRFSDGALIRYTHDQLYMGTV